MMDGNLLTLDSIRATMRLLNEATAESELSIFLSDNWPAYSILKQGGEIMTFEGKHYAVAVPRVGDLQPDRARRRMNARIL